ncbi:MAG: acyltransferase family protein [Bacteroidales bacterium]|nr:acyltransferase family protein [Bacteroidales bacterium]
MRDRSLDIGKGIAILFVYLGHSIIYHPIILGNIPWCHILERFIVSFNLPMFFIISGYLFSKTSKSTIEIYKGKTQRILFPYLLTMAVIISMKLVLPTSMSYNESVQGGIRAMISNALLYGGDRWFVYTLYIIFLILIPIRSWLKNKWFDIGLIIVLITLFFLVPLPEFLALNKVCVYMVFFISGYALNKYYLQIMALKYWWAIYVVFIVLNLSLIEFLSKLPFVFRFILPFSGTLAMMTLAFQVEKSIKKSKVVQYLEYCGKYSLQFYLFTFCYPLIRVFIVSILHITNPLIIIISVFILQLIAITIIVEVTRRIKWLKIPCGY